MRFELNEKNKVLFLVTLSCLFLASHTYFGISDPHAWRQADVYAQILGFMNAKGMQPLTDFLGHTAIYDIPIYQWLVAALGYVTVSDPLPTARVMNIPLWVITVLAGYSISELLRKKSGFLFLYLITISPVFFHYFSAPMVDNLAIAAALVAICLVFRFPKNFYSIAFASVLILTASLVKSPIAFICVFFLLSERIKRYGVKLTTHDRPLMVFLTAALAGAIGAELIRKAVLSTDFRGFAQDPSWYFGSISQRTDVEFWKIMGSRILDYFPTHALGLMILLPIFIGFLIRPFFTCKTLWTFLVTYLSGWLIFANVYAIHDYYQMPTIVFLLIGISIFYSSITDSINNSKITQALHIVLMLSTPFFLLKNTKKNELFTDNFYSSASFALKDSNLFLYVNHIGESAGPVMGGRLKTPLKIITHKEFEADCEFWLRGYKAIVVEGRAPCFSQAAGPFKAYLANVSYQMYVRE